MTWFSDDTFSEFEKEEPMTDEEIEKEFWEFERQNKDKINTRKDAYLAGRRKGREEIRQLKFELLMVSKIASDIPMFYSPFNAIMAKQIRDKVLKNASDYLEEK